MTDAALRERAKQFIQSRTFYYNPDDVLDLLVDFGTHLRAETESAVWEQAAAVAEAHHNTYSGGHDCYDGGCQTEIVKELRAAASRSKEA